MRRTRVSAAASFQFLLFRYFIQYFTVELQKMSDVLLNFIAGGVGGSCTVIVGHPFDTVKVV